LQALLWFRSPPRYFARWTRQAAAEQVAALEAFMAEVSTVAALGLPVPPGHGQGTAGWPSYDASTKDGVGAVHPVWGVQQPAVGGYIQLLNFLCAEELARLRVWYQPLSHADALRATVTVRISLMNISANLEDSCIKGSACVVQEHSQRCQRGACTAVSLMSSSTGAPELLPDSPFDEQ
jgi:hypothetical protein